jgi:hypothetical protein
MITATVSYKLPPHIDYAACRAHFHRIAPGSHDAKGLISKHFIWAFYGGPRLDGIVERYGMKPQIEFYEVFAITDNSRGTVDLFEAPAWR